MGRKDMVWMFHCAFADLAFKCIVGCFPCSDAGPKGIKFLLENKPVESLAVPTGVLA